MRLPTISTRTDTLFPSTTLVRSTARDDHVRGAVHQRQESVLVDPSDVAVAIEEIPVAIVPVHRFGRVGTVVVSGHHRRRAADDFADRSLRQPVALFVDHLRDMAGRGLAAGWQLAGTLVRLEDARRAYLVPDRPDEQTS